MSEIINLRTARKRAKRLSDEQQANAQRALHGQPKNIRNLEAARRDLETRTLNGHKNEAGGRP